MLNDLTIAAMKNIAEKGGKMLSMLHANKNSAFLDWIY